MSSGSESDDDYVPGEPEQVSEEDSANEETELQYEKEVQHNMPKKRKLVQERKGKKKQKTKNSIKEVVPEMVQEEKFQGSEAVLVAEAEKKREDELWAMFLDGTDTKPKHDIKESIVNKPSAKSSTATENIKAEMKKETNQNDDSKARERRIFEFAGETIVVENNMIKEKSISVASPGTASKEDTPTYRGRGTGGLSSVLGHLNKKNTLSTLEKSKLDWLTYKKEEGIEEEIESHNKGKSGYLDRQDFLERADHRQYEIERDLRMSRRSKR